MNLLFVKNSILLRHLASIIILLRHVLADLLCVLFYVFVRYRLPTWTPKGSPGGLSCQIRLEVIVLWMRILLNRMLFWVLRVYECFMCGRAVCPVDLFICPFHITSVVAINQRYACLDPVWNSFQSLACLWYIHTIRQTAQHSVCIMYVWTLPGCPVCRLAIYLSFKSITPPPSRVSAHHPRPPAWCRSRPFVFS